MKAKLYTFENKSEVRISNKSYTSTEGETKKDFLARVAGLLEADFDEAIDVVEVSIKSLEKLDDEFLVEAYKVSKGVQEAIIKSIMAARGIEFEKVEKVSKARVQPRDKAEMQASEEYLAAKANVGKLVSYTPSKKDEVYKGIIKSISLNKINTIIYYNVQCGDNLRCCTANNESLVFYEI